MGNILAKLLSILTKPWDWIDGKLSFIPSSFYYVPDVISILKKEKAPAVKHTGKLKMGAAYFLTSLIHFVINAIFVLAVLALPIAIITYVLTGLLLPDAQEEIFRTVFITYPIITIGLLLVAYMVNVFKPVYCYDISKIKYVRVHLPDTPIKKPNTLDEYKDAMLTGFRCLIYSTGAYANSVQGINWNNERTKETSQELIEAAQSYRKLKLKYNTTLVGRSAAFFKKVLVISAYSIVLMIAMSILSVVVFLALEKAMGGSMTLSVENVVGIAMVALAFLPTLIINLATITALTKQFMRFISVSERVNELSDTLVFCEQETERLQQIVDRAARDFISLKYYDEQSGLRILCHELRSWEDWLNHHRRYSNPNEAFSTAGLLQEMEQVFSRNYTVKSIQSAMTAYGIQQGDLYELQKQRAEKEAQIRREEERERILKEQNELIEKQNRDIEELNRLNSNLSDLTKEHNRLKQKEVEELREIRRSLQR